MAPSGKRSFDVIIEHHLQLLAALLLLLGAVPLVEARWVGDVPLHFGFTAVFLAGILAGRRSRLFLVLGLVLALLAIPASWSAFLWGSRWLTVTSQLLGALFFAWTACVILADVLGRRMGTAQALFGAVSAYLLFGLAWAELYATLEQVEPEAFVFANPPPRHVLADGREATAFSHLVYFSFVTMTTLGFGDTTPHGSLTKTFTWAQAVFGQFYIAVLVAYLVSALGSRRKDRPPGRETEP
jgi:voltage-gated potassium channel